MLSPEVWQTLDPYVGRLRRRTRKRLSIFLVVGALASAALITGHRVGLLDARLAWARQGGYMYSVPPGGPVQHELVVTNDGMVNLRLVGAGRSGPGLELISAEGSPPQDSGPGFVAGTFPMTLHPGETTSFLLTYSLDCTLVRNEPWPVPVRVASWWGEQTAYIDMPTSFGPPWSHGWAENMTMTLFHAGDDGPQYDSDGRPIVLEWQSVLADKAC